MENIFNVDEVDFSKASYTAVVSDLHLCEEEPVCRKFPLWKKYKTKEFFFDEKFREFLNYIDAGANESVSEKDVLEKNSVELVLNGDIFDFDSVTYVPPSPTYSVSWLERLRGLNPEEEKSVDKIKIILKDHPVWCEGLKWFIGRGHRVVFIIGNHDLELHWRKVQIEILNHLDLSREERTRVRFSEWFYISNKDTLLEHGNQYDPYCLCDDPVNPLVVDYNRVQVRLPFGDWACRYLVNVMGYFNPHVDANYESTAYEYMKVFFKYMLRAQPFILWTWFWSCVAILWRTVASNMQRPLSDPLTAERRVENIAQRANATPRIVREMRALFVIPYASTPLRIMKVLWLDRAFIFLIGLIVLLQTFIIVKQVYSLSFFWLFIPILTFLPPFFLYAQGVDTYISYYKKPNERVLTTSARITHVNRVIYGHSHEVRHELVGGMEHLNSGTWSPAFKDVECTMAEDQKTFIWITPGEQNRQAQVLQVTDQGIREYQAAS